MTPSVRLAILSAAGRDDKSRYGGPTRMLVKLANQLHRDGIVVDMVVFPPRGSEAAIVDLDPAIAVVNLRAQGKLAQILSLTRYIRSSAPEALLTAGHRPNVLGCWACMLAPRRTRLYIGVRNTPSASLRAIGARRRHLRRWVMRALYPRAEGIVAVSHGVASDLAEVLGIAASRIRVIHNPVVTADVAERALEPADHPWLTDTSCPVVLACGRLAKQKDFATLLRAFAELVVQRDARLIVLGDGDERQPLKALVGQLGLQARVALPGFVSNPYAYMSRADLFVLSSAWEGFGNVIVEALSVGLPVVATDCPSGPREILQDGDYGPLVPVADPAALATAMAHVLDNPPLRAKLLERAGAFDIAHGARLYRQYLKLGA